MSGSRVRSDAQTDCRHFSGYKPCPKNEVCSASCPAKQIAGPRILIIHLEAMGAVLRATCLARAAKRHWPEAHITWITDPISAPLLENNPDVDRVLRNDHNGVLALSSLSFDLTFAVDKSLAAGGLLRVPVSAGTAKGFGVAPDTGAIVPLNPEATRLYELGLSNHEKFYVNKKPENRLLVEAMGLEFKNDEYVFRFTAAETERRESERSRLGAGAGFGHPVIGLNTGCSGAIPYKKLTVAGWVELIQVLHSRFPSAPLVLLGGPEDTERNKEIKTKSKAPLIETPTRDGVRNGMIYADLCNVIVTGDSLGLHMGIALKKWTVAWFGPTCAHEIDFYGRGVAVLTKAGCSPCWKRECHKRVMCYDLVDWNEVLSGVEAGVARLPSAKSA